MKKSTQKGFTLIELLVSVGIIALLSSVILSATNSARKNARDSKRIASIRELQVGLELYYTDNQKYPDNDTDEVQVAETANGGSGYGYWDTPEDGDFLDELVSKGYMKDITRDPLGGDFQRNLRYYKFPANDYNCPANRGAYYVLGIADMETSAGRHQLSPGWACPDPGGFDFGDPENNGFEFVVGKYES